MGWILISIGGYEAAQLLRAGGLAADRFLIPVGAVVSVELVWALGTLLNGFMAFPNLIGMLFLLGTIKQLTSQYFDGSPKTP